MNLRKHVAGFVIFSTIVGSAIFINAYLTAPIARVQPVWVSETVPQSPVESAQPINFRVRMVSLDFINKKSYTELKLERQKGQPAPKNLWITTVFFLPSSPTGKILTSTIQVRQPFARSDSLEFVAVSSCDWCESPGVLKDGYFARVYVSIDYDNLYPLAFDEDITTAIPVVVQAAREVTR